MIFVEHNTFLSLRPLEVRLNFEEWVEMMCSTSRRVAAVAAAAVVVVDFGYYHRMGQEVGCW